MKVTWSGVGMVGGTGKLGGTVIQGGRFGSIARIWKRPTVVNLANFNTNSEKIIFRQIVSNWRGLSPSDRTSWQPPTPVGLSGYNLYVQANLISYRVNGVFLTTAPIALTYPPSSLTSPAVDSGTGNFTIVYSNTNLDLTWKFNFFIINNLSTGVTSPQKSQFRLIGIDSVLNGLGTYTVRASVKGVAPIAGSQSIIKIVMINVSTGQSAAPLYFSAIVT
jgi:hypothetical protein